MVEKEQSRLVSANEIGERVGLHAKTIRRYALEGKIPSVPVAHNVVRFDYEKVEAALKAMAKKRQAKKRKSRKATK